MKAILNRLILLVVVLMWSVACKNDETKITYIGGTTPVLSVSSTNDLVLTKAQEAYSSVQFQWTNPQYSFSNGASTQDVYYTLQIDTTGSGFTNPKISEVVYTNDVFHAFTVKELDDALGVLERPDYKVHPFEFRIKATLANKNEPLYSNVIKINITTYLDALYPPPANLYIVGDATPSGWSNDSSHPDASQTFTKVNPYTFELKSINLAANQFLFIPVAGSWDHKYAYDAPDPTNNVDGDKFKPDVKSNFQAPAAGKYKIVVNFKTGKYSMTKL